MSEINEEAEGRESLDDRSGRGASVPKQQLLIKVMLILFVGPVIAQLNSIILGLAVTFSVGFLPAEWQLSIGKSALDAVQVVAVCTGILAVWKFWPKKS